MIFGNKNSLWGKGEKVFNTTLGDDLLCCLKLDETSGVIAKDAFGKNDFNNVNATINQVGKLDKSYLFNGINSYLNNNTLGGIISNSNVLTVSCWFKGSPATGGIFEYGSSNKLRIYVSGGKILTLQIVNGTLNLKRSVNVYNDNLWHNIIAIFDRNQTGINQSRLIIDGVENNSDLINNTLSGNLENSDIRIASYLTDENYLFANLDQIALWNRGITSTEIALINNSGDGLNFNNW